MSLLWSKVSKYRDNADEDGPWRPMTPYHETHDEHSLHPTFEAAGIGHAPCAYTRCDDFDQDHSDAFDEAERRMFEHHENGDRPPVERISLSDPQPLGMESTVDRRTLLKYQADPRSRSQGHPTFFRHGGQHYILNGHHGTAAAMRRGDKHMLAHVIDLDKD